MQKSGTLSSYGGINLIEPTFISPTGVYARIAGTGSYLPERILTNDEIAKRVDTSDEWIFSRTGIRERHIVAEGETSSMMAEQAARRALEAAGISAEQLQLIIVATCTPDKLLPSTACLLQARLGAHGCPAFDISIACAGFNYGLAVADQFIRNKTVNYALVVGVEVMSSLVDWDDRSTCILFGDGAGAVVLKGDSQPGILSTHLHADGRYGELLSVETGIRQKEEPKINMKGNEVFKVAVNSLGDVLTETLEANRILPCAVDWLIPHQANMRIIAAMAKKLDLSMERVIVTVDKHGNTSAASVPLALDTAVREGKIQRGETLLLESFGAGFAWGSALINY